MSLIQEEFNKSSGDFLLSPGEYEGPLLIDRPCVVDGQHSTIWANCGPVVIVDSPSVTLKNLRIEVTGSQEKEHPAVSLKLNHQGTKLENVEINGKRTEQEKPRNMGSDDEEYLFPRCDHYSAG